MSAFCRKTYNGTYYAKNRERILLKRRIRQKHPTAVLNAGENQLSLFEQSTFSFDASKNRWNFKFEMALNFALILLVLSNSYLLLHDAVEFYRLNDSHAETSLGSAVVVEGMLIALSIIRPSNRVLKYVSKSALLLLFFVLVLVFLLGADWKGNRSNRAATFDRSPDKSAGGANARPGYAYKSKFEAWQGHSSWKVDF